MWHGALSWRLAGFTELRWPAPPAYRRATSHGAWGAACGGPTSPSTSTYVFEIVVHVMGAWASLCDELEGSWVLSVNHASYVSSPLTGEGTPEASFYLSHSTLGRSGRKIV